MTQNPPPPHPPPSQNFWGDAPEHEFYASQGIKNQKQRFNTPHGTIFTQSWFPAYGGLKGIVCCTHGYGSDTNWMFQKIPIAFAQWGYGAFGADLLGHGQSDGLHGYVEDIWKTASASLHFFQSVRDRPEYKGLPKYLFGESMGGGVTFLMLLMDQQNWSGAIFSAPLFVMPEAMKPSRARLFMYGLLGGMAERWAVMPESNMVRMAVKDGGKGKVIGSNPRRYKGAPRVGTMRQLNKMCEVVMKRCEEVELPILLLHGTADELAAPDGSHMVMQRARSPHKTLKLYDGMYHSLIQGETDDNIEKVLSDIREWLNDTSHH